jgi:3-methyladenine DNA glycosylase Mpg
VATGQMLRGLIAVREDDNHRVEMRMIEAEAYIKDIIEADAGAHGFETQGLGSVERKVTLGIGVHGGAKFA